MIVAPCAAQQVESGRFVLFKYQQPVGEESYTVRRDGSSLLISATSRLSFLGGEVPLTATLRTRADGTQEQFEAKGRTSTLTHTDVAVQLRGDSAVVRRMGQTRTVPVPERFFAAGHYGPVTLTQMLFRYWAAHGRPERLALLPAGEVRFAQRGRDRVQADSGSVVLDRWTVEGLAWGRQSLWLDSKQRLIAVVGADAELDRFQAVRAGYETVLPTFARGAIRDGLADLQRIAQTVKPTRSGTYALVGGTLVDGTGRAPVLRSTVVVRDGRILAAGPSDSVQIPPGVARIDATGRTVLPGLWDMHVHYSQPEWLAAGLASGVTTARDAANEFELVTALRDAVRDGRALGPRLMPAGVVDGGEHPLGVVVANNPDEARAVVRRYHAAGFPQIKIYGSLKPELVRVITEEAHRLGMTVTGHVPDGMNALQFIQAGADQINHLNYITAVLRGPAQPGQPLAPLDLNSEAAQAAIRALRQRGTVIEPSLARLEQHAHPRNVPFARFEPGTGLAPIELEEALNTTGVPPEAAERGAAALDRALQVVGALHRAGVPLVFGTDLVVPGHTMHRELELAVRAGLTPMEAIHAATLVAARAMGADRHSGSVQPGKRADLVMVRGDPLRDIREIRNVEAVVTGGFMYDPASLWQAAGFAPVTR